MASPSPAPDPRRRRILAVTLVIGFMALLDVTIVNVALPSIRAGLGASTAAVQWIVSGYALTFGLTLVLGGRLGDGYGRRMMILIGLTAFIVTSAAVGLAPNEAMVVAARLAQGAAAGLLTPQSSGIIQQLFQGAERGRAFGYFALTVSISASLGPILGGLIIAALGPDLGWRAIFLVNVPIGLVALVFVARLVPPRPRELRSTERLDLVGALLLGGGVLCVLFPLVEAMGNAGAVQWLYLLAPVLLVGFVRWERRLVARGGAPLLDVALLRSVPGYSSGIAVGSAYFAGFTGVFLVLSIYLQEGLGYTPLAAGLTLTPFAVGSAVSSAPAGRWVSTWGRQLTVFALLLVLAGIGAVAVVLPLTEGRVREAAIVAGLLLAGLGGGAVVSPNFTLTLADVPPRMGGAAGGAVQTGQRIGAAIGAALLVTVYEIGRTRTGEDDLGALAALVTALAVLVLALALALRDLRQLRPVGLP